MLVTTSMNLLDALSPNAVNKMQQGNSEYIMYLSSGNRPSPAHIDSLIQNQGYESFYNWTLAPIYAPLGGKTVLALVNMNQVLPIEWDAERIAFKFSAITDQAASALDAAPTWGLLGFWPRNASVSASAHTDWQLRSLLYFTVGDQNSGEDMLIQGGVIPKGTMWKPNDIVLTLTGAIK